MVKLGRRAPKEAREIAQWMHENVAKGDHEKPTHVSAISRTLYWNSSDKSSWEVKHHGLPPGIVSVSGIPDDMLLIFLLRFNQ